MLKSIFIFSFLSMSFFDSLAQSFDIDRKYYEDNVRLRYSINLTRNFNLFNAKEIKRKKITTAYVFEAWGPRDEEGNAARKDTFLIYLFDTSGRVTHEINVNKNAKKSKDTTLIYYGLCEKVVKNSYYKTSFKASKIGNDSVFIKYELWENNGRMDTAYTHKYIYDKKGHLLEQTTIKFKNYPGKGDELERHVYHSKYTYDTKGRLTSINDGYTYTKISYPFYGKLIEKYPCKTRKLIDREAILIKKTKQATTEISRTLMVTTTLLEDNDLIGRSTIVNLTEFPEIQYFDFGYK